MRENDVKNRFIVLFVLGVCGAIAACSGDSDDGGGSATDCKSAARALCTKLQSCADLLLTVTYGSLDTCANRVSLGCTAQVGAPGSNVDESAFAGCANAIAASSCDALFSDDSPDECRIPGTLDDGTQCGFGSQCKSSACISSAAGNCGTCAPLAPAGSSCGVAAGCEDGLVCFNSVCAQPVAAGGACSGTFQCAGNLVCKSGTCAKPGGANADCDPAAGDCDVAQGLSCNPITTKCEKPSVAGAGEACGIIQQKVTVCTAGSCEGATLNEPGTCVPAIADGAACSATDGPSCLEPAECVNGLCTLPAAC